MLLEMNAHKETIGLRVVVLRRINNIATTFEQKTGNGVDNSHLVGARQGQNVIWVRHGCSRVWFYGANFRPA